MKLKEYLAVGRPVVSTPFPELERFQGLVEVASDAQGFAQAIRRMLADPGDADARRERVREETWASKGNLVLRALSDRGLEPITLSEA